MKSRHGIAVVAVAVLWISAVDLCAREGTKDWVVLKDCTLILNPANDGDSFHVSVGLNEYLFRLYFVDAPETDEMTPRRLVDQAKYFEITVPQAIEVGRAAREFTRQKLSGPFTVFTHMSDAMGQSRLERFYAFVQTREGDLGEQLVRNGLARTYGFKAAPPGLGSWQVEMAKLHQLEQQARQEKIGAWGIDAGRLNVHSENQSSFSVFVPAEKHSRGAVPKTLPAVLSSTPQPTASPAAAASAESKTSHRKQNPPVGRVDVNTATEKELRTVPGIGPVIAARIIATRPFRSADDLKKVNGIGDKNYAKMRPYFH
jgi:DNA uptake protein ComE-like DNA-binding protein/endonuclease YncB( thermonuclease family)